MKMMQRVLQQVVLFFFVAVLFGCSSMTIIDPGASVGDLYGQISSFGVLSLDTSRAGFEVKLLTDQEIYVSSIITDSTGRFHFVGVSTGTYEIRVTKAGYAETRRQQIQFVAPGTLGLLKPIPFSELPAITNINTYIDTVHVINKALTFNTTIENMPEQYKSLAYVPAIVSFYTADPATASAVDSVVYASSILPVAGQQSSFLIPVDSSLVQSMFAGYHGTLFARVQPSNSDYTYYDIHTRQYHYAVNGLTPLIEFERP